MAFDVTYLTAGNETTTATNVNAFDGVEMTHYQIFRSTYGSSSTNSSTSQDVICFKGYCLMNLDPINTPDAYSLIKYIEFSSGHKYNANNYIQLLLEEPIMLTMGRYLGKIYYGNNFLLTPRNTDNCMKFSVAYYKSLGYNNVQATRIDSFDEFAEFILNKYTSFHSDPVFKEATKLTYTDGTYNFARGVKTANEARQAAYNSLLKTYGSFYRATEKELSNAFAQSIE